MFITAGVLKSLFPKNISFMKSRRSFRGKRVAGKLSPEGPPLDRAGRAAGVCKRRPALPFAGPFALGTCCAALLPTLCSVAFSARFGDLTGPNERPRMMGPCGGCRRRAGPMRLCPASKQDVVFVLRCAPLVHGPVPQVRFRRKQASQGWRASRCRAAPCRRPLALRGRG